MSTAPHQNAIIGENIKRLRESQGLTQETLSQYLNTSREQIAYYESGKRAISTDQLSKLANLFCMDEYDFYEEDIERKKINLAFAFRAESLDPQDFEHIARFKKIVRNYLNMKSALND